MITGRINQIARARSRAGPEAGPAGVRAPRGLARARARADGRDVPVGGATRARSASWRTGLLVTFGGDVRNPAPRVPGPARHPTPGALLTARPSTRLPQRPPREAAGGRRRAAMTGRR